MKICLHSKTSTQMQKNFTGSEVCIDMREDVL